MRYILSWCFFLITCFAPAAAQADNARMLLQRFQDASAHTRTLFVTFHQTKHLAILDDELLSEGLLCMHQTDTQKVLLWEYTSPSISGFAYEDGVFSLWTRERSDKHQARGNEVVALRAMSKQILLWLQADVSTLEQTYTLDVLPPTEQNAYEGLRLTPKKPSRYFSFLEVRFDTSMETLRELTLFEPQGDFTRLAFTRTERNGLLSEQCTP